MRSAEAERDWDSESERLILHDYESELSLFQERIKL
jgi:hypothetical protein